MNRKRRHKGSAERQAYLEKRRLKKKRKKLMETEISSYEEIKIKPIKDLLIDSFRKRFKAFIKKEYFFSRFCRDRISFLLEMEGRKLYIHFFTDGNDDVAITKGGKNNSLHSYYQVGGLYKKTHQNYLSDFLFKLRNSLVKGFANEKRGIQIATKFAMDYSYNISYSKELDDNGVDFQLEDKEGDIFYFQIKSSVEAILSLEENKKTYKGKKINFITVHKYRTDYEIYGNIKSSTWKLKNEYRLQPTA